MSEPKGPKVDLPSELMAELDEGGELKTEAAAPAGPGDPAVAAELAELKDRHLRLAAEYDNFRRRSLKERQDLHNYANENLVKELLPIVDNLERAVGHARKEEQRSDSDNLLQGVELTYRSLLQILARIGVVEIAALGQPFDPQIHEAVRRVPAPDKPAGTVVEIYQKGYMLKDRMLRPAMVAVASEAS
ncbi:MAG TPA: nucleotide exchange factor GrpE [Myxococcota bacterium]|nr:nucleotide exchange factor GrpE [Myxococcota bacterium]